MLKRSTRLGRVLGSAVAAESLYVVRSFEAGNDAVRGPARRTRLSHMSSRVLTAVAWPYANGPRHIGHVSGFGVPSDVFSRYLRMGGHDVLMVSGTDEHGTPILVQAEREGLTTRETADKYNRVIAEDLQGLGLSYDLFTRTTTRNHYGVVQERVPRPAPQRLRRGEDAAMGAISPSTGRTLPDRYIEGTCPICGYDGARGDQCDNCGNQLDPIDLINPRSRINGETPKFVETEHLFLDLPALAGSLGSWLSSRTDWRPNVLKFSQNLLEDLKPRAITRDLDWGVPVPLDGWRDQPMKRLYVWFDAVIGYLSASVEWAPSDRRPGGVAEVVGGPGGARLLLHGQGQHHLPLRDLAGHPARPQRPGRSRRSGRPAGGAAAARRGGLQRVPDHERVEVLHLAAAR